MRRRDLRKLKSGQRLLVRLSKATLSVYPTLVEWNGRAVYVDYVCSIYDNVYFRSSKRIRHSTQHDGPLYARDVVIVNDPKPNKQKKE
jgi:hypothetical protein